jgi:arylsulfatase A-like enzyme
LASGPSDRPRYIEVNLEEPHRPFDQDDAMPETSLGVAVPEFLPHDGASVAEMAAFQGAIARADEAVGAILDAIEAAGLREDTLVIFLADHGMAMPRAKCTLYDPGIEVALMMRWPGGDVAGGRGVEGLVSQVDVLPTVMDAVGLAREAQVQGRSVLSLARGQAGMGREAAFAGKTYHSYYDPMRAVRTARYKLIRNFEASFAVEVPGDVQEGPIFQSHAQRYHGGQHPLIELYDLEADPWEQTNLTGEAAHAEVQAQLDALLWRWMEETGDPLLKGPVASPAYRRAIQSRL